jgi:predicted dehydrogenase
MLRVGVIGVGGWTEICHIPGVQAHPEARVVALCGRSAERRQAQAARFGVPETFADYNELLARAEVDAVTISTPNRWHHPIARAALLAGKHVFCEKPLAMDQTESAELLALAERGGLANHVAFTFRFLHAAHEAQRLVRGGAIGRLRRILAVTEGGGALRSTAQARWRNDAALSGYGLLGDMGSHLVDLARFVAGGEFRRVRGAAWRIGRAERPDGDQPGRMRAVTADDEAEALCDFAGPGAEAAATVRVSSLTPPPHRNYLEFVGDGGYIRLAYSRGETDTLALGREGASPEPLPLPPGTAPAPSHCLYKMMGAFVDACLGRPSPPPADQPATFADGHAAQRVLDAIATSARSGAPVDL